MLKCVFSIFFNLWVPISPEVMIARTCKAHRSKAESLENVSEDSNGVLKREPKILKNLGCGIWNFELPLEVIFWMCRHNLWSLSFRAVCSLCLCNHYFGRYRRRNFKKWLTSAVCICMLKRNFFLWVRISKPIRERFKCRLDQTVIPRL